MEMQSRPGRRRLMRIQQLIMMHQSSSTPAVIGPTSRLHWWAKENRRPVDVLNPVCIWGH